jgi:DNA-binding NarL/FixJ family response regulator
MEASEDLTETNTPLRIVIADLDPRVRRGLRALLETQSDMAVIGEADTAARALECATTLHPSVVLLDLMLPTKDAGLAIVRILAAHHQPCIVTSWHGSLREAALRMGASGFVEKGDAPEMVFAAIRGTHNGHSGANSLTPAPTL